MTIMQCTVLGTPVTQGSKVAYRRSGGGTALLDTNRKTLKPWREHVTEIVRTYLAAWEVTNERKWEPLTGPLWCALAFTLERPKSHPKRRRTWPTNRQDIDKLSRAVLDALTDAGMWCDDGQVITLIAAKDYGPEPGVLITVHAEPEAAS